jgi:hypothetical protein
MGYFNLPSKTARQSGFRSAFVALKTISDGRVIGNKIAKESENVRFARAALGGRAGQADEAFDLVSKGRQRRVLLIQGY